LLNGSLDSDIFNSDRKHCRCVICTGLTTEMAPDGRRGAAFKGEMKLLRIAALALCLFTPTSRANPIIDGTLVQDNWYFDLKLNISNIADPSGLEVANARLTVDSVLLVSNGFNSFVSDSFYAPNLTAAPFQGGDIVIEFKGLLDLGTLRYQPGLHYIDFKYDLIRSAGKDPNATFVFSFTEPVGERPTVPDSGSTLSLALLALGSLAAFRKLSNSRIGD
jgi:hypothetical protein